MLRKIIHETTGYHDDPFGNVLNLTQGQFTYNEFKLLNKKLNFIPNPGSYNTHNFQKDAESFFRNVILRSHFGNEENRQQTQHKFNKTTSQRLPKQTHHSRVFTESLQKNLMHIQPPKSKYKDNLTKGERKAVNGLREREDITITKADKGEQ